MKTVKQACTPRASVFDPTRRDTVLDLGDLIDGRIDPAEFFAENHVTEGMRTLLTEGFRRLEGKSAQGVFKLTQAMGGGKTHNLLALGLLAAHPEYRPEVMGGFYTPDPALGPVRVVAFSGRESDAPLGIWGAIAEQLGRKEQFNDYYAPLAAPGQTAWVNLLRGEPLVIMLDELPPYFVNAASKSIGNSDLSAVTTTALSNLLVAVGRDELRHVCLVISDLKASYGAGAARIVAALDDLEAETGRAAMNLEPVRMNTDEFYRILRKRIFETLPDEAEIEEVAKAYAKAVREARQMDVTNASPEQFAAQVAESYPFHPAIRALYGRFRENQGFQQTRGLIRLMRIVVSRIWTTDHDPCLIAAHDVDPDSRETLTEINQINSTLENAIAHDVASGGNAVAETIDANLGGGEDARDVMRLLLIASLANVPNAVKGLTVPEIVAHLCAPGRDVSKLKNEVVARLVTAAWYLHTTNDGRLHLRNVQNLIARVTTTAGAYLRDQATKELKERLTEIFEVAIQLMTITAASAGSIGSVIKGVSSLTDENTDEKLTWSGGSIYEGEIRNGKMHGKGVYTWLDGERHEGEFHDDEIHGKGVRTWPDGRRYEGEFVNGNFHGQSVETSPDGERIEGEWREGEFVNDMMHGQSVQTFSDDVRYVGEYRDGNMHGQGVYTYPDGRRYEGEFVNDNFHGQGVFTTPSGRRLEGEYRDGKLHGQGVYTWPSGSRYEGEWRDGEKWKGIEMAPNGRAFIYRDGKQI